MFVWAFLLTKIQHYLMKSNLFVSFSVFSIPSNVMNQSLRHSPLRRGWAWEITPLRIVGYFYQIMALKRSLKTSNVEKNNQQFVGRQDANKRWMDENYPRWAQKLWVWCTKDITLAYNLHALARQKHTNNPPKAMLLWWKIEKTTTWKLPLSRNYQYHNTLQTMLIFGVFATTGKVG